MRIDKAITENNIENAAFIFVYILLFVNAFLVKDSLVAVISAFCGISYTILAGKGIPACYLIGVVGSVFYSYLSFKSALWGNLTLYAGYYVPMQILGFFQWNKHLKQKKNEIIKVMLSLKERVMMFILTTFVSIIVIYVLNKTGDTRPFIDGITTVFSVLGMYLTVKRCVEQWIIWIIVNFLSLLMWLTIALSGEKVYSTVLMWAVYFGLAIYFYICWRKDLQEG